MRRWAQCSIAPCALLAVSAFHATPALAQEAAQAQTQPQPSCKVAALPGEAGGASTIIASCKGRGFMLGKADSYTVRTNPGLDVTLVDLTWGETRRIYAISFPGGEPLLEDISGSLSRAAGRGPMAPLKGLEIDFGTFAQDGVVEARIPPSAAQAAGEAGEVNLGQQVAAEASRRGQAQAAE